MNNLWYLLKIQLLSFLGINQYLHSKNAEEKKKSRNQLIIMGIGLLAIAYISVYYSSILMDSFSSFNAEYLAIALFTLSATAFVLVTSVKTAAGSLFDFKDYDQIMSLPVKTSTIVIIRLFSIYLGSLLYAILLMVPAEIIYGVRLGVGVGFYLPFIIGIFLVPIIPMIIGSVVGILVSYISSFFKKSNLVSLLTNIIFVVLILGLSYFAGDTTINYYDLIGGLIAKVYSKYPLLEFFMKGVCDYDYIWLILFGAISILSFIIFAFIIAKLYKRINTLVTSKHTSSKYQMGKLKSVSPDRALLKREFQRYFASPIYVINTAFGPLISIAMVVMIIFMGIDNVDQTLQMEGMLKDNINSFAPLILGLFSGLTCTTSASISLDGSSFYIAKALPIEEYQTLKAKLYLNIILSSVAFFIDAIILSIILKPNIITILCLFIIPLLYSAFIACCGLLLNLKFPNFEWKNETQVVKQSLPAFISIMIGMLPAIMALSMASDVGISSNLYLTIIAGVLVIIDLILWKIVKTWGTKTLKKLYN